MLRRRDDEVLATLGNFVEKEESGTQLVRYRVSESVTPPALKNVPGMSSLMAGDFIPILFADGVIEPNLQFLLPFLAGKTKK